MFIIGRTGKTYARLAFHSGPGAQLSVPTAVDWSAWPRALAHPDETLDVLRGQWRQEYAAHVHVHPEAIAPWAGRGAGELLDEQDWWDDHPWTRELDATFYEPREQLIHEPVSRPHLS